MANEKGMPEDKKARLEAIRAANAAKKAAGGDAAPATPAAQIVDAPATTVAAQIVEAPAEAAGGRVAAGANMSDDKKAKLEAIRAANAAKKAGGAQVVDAPAPAAAPAAVATRPVATTAAPAATPAPRPAAAARPAARPAPVEDERLPRRVLLIRMLVGAIFGIILCLLLATMTGYYIRGAVAGLFLGALSGLLVLSWPPERTTGEG